MLLDSHQIPIGMKMYPGNESEKPILRDVIDHLKRQNSITGKTIYVADKGLNCIQNIAFSKKNGDGYLFSKTVKGLSEKEKVWVLLDQGFRSVKDRSGKVLYRYKSCIDKFPYTVEHEEKKATVGFNQDAIDKDLKFAGYNLLVTSEIEMTDKDIYNTYHNFWRIEESFRIMKSDLDARPVYLQKEDTIKGHFLICYLAVLLERIFQFKILENKYSTSEIINFIKDFRATKSESKYINTTTYSDFINDLSNMTGLPLVNYFLTETQIKSMFTH